uniref:Ski2_N domain-containing protein n=1 Tax=Caenorhabditis tropicalis TaxID=1561998 RepID=A0A1I7UCT5_9PELO
MLEEKAERLFRLECLETLNWPPCAPIPAHIVKQDPKLEFHNVAENLKSLLQPIDTPINIVADVDSNGKIVGFVEHDRVVVGSANTSMSINRAPFKQKSLQSSVGNSIKGSPGNVPFLPGFLEELDEILENSKSEKPKMGDEKKYLDFNDEGSQLKSVPTIGQIKLPDHIPKKNQEEKSKMPDIDAMNAFDILNFVTSSDPMTYSISARKKKQNQRR